MSGRKFLRGLLRAAADLSGHACVLCGGAAHDSRLCVPCHGSLPLVEHPCPRCGRPLAAALPDGVECGRCLVAPPPFRKVRAAALYAFPVDTAIRSFKFDARLWYAPAFAELMLRELVLHFPWVDALLPVPLHRWRHARRGFNQAFELARPLALHSALPLVTDTRRVRHTRPQAGLTAAERRRNLRRAFVVTRRLRCRHPLIIDDVLTTGETCTQLARALLGAGARDVSVLTVARAAK